MKKILSTLLFFAIISSGFALDPVKKYRNHPHHVRLKYEQITIPTPDGASLNAWYFPSNNGDQLMVMSHDGSGNMGDYLNRVKIFTQYGFNVLCYDYRGYGESSDFKIDNYVYIYKEFFLDFDAVIAYCSERFHHHEIIAYGWGVGGGISITHGYNRQDVTGIISDDPFIDFISLKRIFDDKKVIMSIPDGMDHSDYNTMDVVVKSPGIDLRGILLFHSNRNYFYTEEDVNTLLDKINIPNKELYLFSHAKHMDNFATNESAYARKIYAFVMNL